MNAEGILIPFIPRDWKDCHGITLCCAVLNEEANLLEFIEWHKPYVDNIVILDGGSSDNTFMIASKLTEHVRVNKFSGHYGNQKNRAIEYALNDWVLFLDPDERLSEDAMKKLRELIDQDKFDAYMFPRKNFVEFVQDFSHGSDHQCRLFRSYCRYVRPIHEELVGIKNQFKFPDDSNCHILHTKVGERHTKRNKAYTTFELLYVKEMGAPGSQTEASFNSRFPRLQRNIIDMKGQK